MKMKQLSYYVMFLLGFTFVANIGGVRAEMLPSVEHMRKNPVISKPLTIPYAPDGDVYLVKDNKPVAVLLIPQQQEYARLAPGFKKKLEEATGRAFEMVAEDSFVPDGRTMIIFGNCFSGQKALRLYVAHLMVCDERYPGKGGHELRSIPDALDWNCDVIFAGGADTEAVTQAFELLIARLSKDDTIVFNQLIDVKSTDPKFVIPETLDNAAIEKKFKDATDYLYSSKSRRTWHMIDAMAETAQGYYYTGDESFVTLYKRLFAVWKEFFYTKFDKTDGWEMPALRMKELAWEIDQVEESGLIPPQMLLDHAEIMRRLTEIMIHEFGFCGKGLKLFNSNKYSMINNGVSYTYHNMAFSNLYLKTHYNFTAVHYWDAIFAHVFGGMMQYDMPHESSAAYGWVIHPHMVTYLIISGQGTDYLKSEMFRRHCDFAAASTNNLGFEIPHGDTGYLFPCSQGMSLRLGTLFFDDPRYEYTAWMCSSNLSAYNVPWTLCRKNKSTPDPPKDGGVAVITVSPNRAESYGITGIDKNNILDKAIFRSGWQKTDNLLALSGLNIGTHTHHDANTIVQYMQGKRVWLLDQSYIRKGIADHNGITVIRDGYFPYFEFDNDTIDTVNSGIVTPKASEIVHNVSSDNIAILTTRLNNYNGLDWNRTVLWTADNGFFVIDDLKSLIEGEYNIRCLWRTLGAISQKGKTTHVRQTGADPDENFFIVNADSSSIELDEQLDAEHGLLSGSEDFGYYNAGYKYAGPITKLVRQIQRQRLEKGDRIQYVNYFATATGESPNIPQVKSIAKNVWVVDSKKPMLIVKGSYQDKNLTIDAKMCLITPEGICAAGARYLQMCGKKWRSRKSEDITFMFRSGVGLKGLKPDEVVAFLDRIGMESKPVVANKEIQSLPIAETGEVAIWNRPSRITDFKVYEDNIITGDVSGNVCLLTQDGTELWRANVGRQVMTVAPILREDKRFWVVGCVADTETRKGRVILFDSAGTKLWSAETEPYAKSTGTVRNVFGADIDGDGLDEIMAAGDYWYCYAFDIDGKKLWSSYYYRSSAKASAFDFDHDGKDEIVIGTSYYHLWMIDSDGSKIADFHFPYTMAPEVTALISSNVNADTTPDVVLGSENGFLWAYDCSGQKLLWRVNVGGRANAIVELPDTAPARFAVASDGCGVIFVSVAGKRLSFTPLPKEAMDMVAFDGELMVLCKDGYIYHLDYAGNVTAKTRLETANSFTRRCPGKISVFGRDKVIVSAGDTFQVVSRKVH
jgi:putative pyrroloquinoline-quinone binding quinoprotein